MSNTEQMVSVPREWVENYADLLEERCAYKASERVQAVLAKPAAQYQGEPVAFYREFVDGREYCEKPFTNDWTPLYTHAAAAGEVERLRAEVRALRKTLPNSTTELVDLRAQLAECEAMAAMIAEREWAEHVGTGPVSSKVEAAFTQLHNDLHETGEKLAERDALLVKANYVIDHARTIDKQAFARGTQNVDHGLFRGLGNLLAQYDEAISAIAEPSAPVERDGWVSVTKRKPEYDKVVLVAFDNHEGKNYTTAHLTNQKRCSDPRSTEHDEVWFVHVSGGHRLRTVTHWREIDRAALERKP